MTYFNIGDVAEHKDSLKSRKLIIPVFVPHMGCPHDCCFCNQRTISGQTEAPTRESVIAAIKSYKDIAGNYGSVEIAFYGGSFTAIPLKQQDVLLKAAQEGCKALDFRPDFRVSTRPDYIDEEILCYLKDNGVKTIELGAQSMCDDILKLSGRGHLSQDTVSAAALIRKFGFVLGIQTMPGLPGSNRDTDIETAEKVIAIKPDIVRIYPTLVIKGTDLERMLLSGEYKPLSLTDAIDICAEITFMYERAGIKVIRTGLQSSDNISSDGDVVAGPCHPAFGELVKSKMALVFMEDGIRQAASSGLWQGRLFGTGVKIKFVDGIVNVSVPAKMLSQFVGQKRCNVISLEKMEYVNKVFIDYK